MSVRESVAGIDRLDSGVLEPGVARACGNHCIAWPKFESPAPADMKPAQRWPHQVSMVSFLKIEANGIFLHFWHRCPGIPIAGANSSQTNGTQSNRFFTFSKFTRIEW